MSRPKQTNPFTETRTHLAAAEVGVGRQALAAAAVAAVALQG
jgi:hypothetical protein